MEKSSAVFHNFFMFLKDPPFCLLGTVSPGLELFKIDKICPYFLCGPCQGANPDLTQLVSTPLCFSESLLEQLGHVQDQLDQILAWCLSRNILYLDVHIIVLPYLAERGPSASLPPSLILCSVLWIKTLCPVVKSSVC